MKNTLHFPFLHYYVTVLGVKTGKGKFLLNVYLVFFHFIPIIFDKERKNCNKLQRDFLKKKSLFNSNVKCKLNICSVFSYSSETKGNSLS